MTGPTPAQTRKLKEAFESVDKNWYVDTAVKEFRRKPMTIVEQILDFFWKKKHTVWEFYWWVRYRQRESDMLPLGNPIESDNLPVAGFPMKYKLNDDWSICEDDLEYLIKGPLVDQSLCEVLVPSAVECKKIWLFIQQYFRIAASIATFIGVVYRYFDELNAFFKGLV